MADKDYYEILGVDKNADESAIKKAYRSLAKKYHPDMNPGDAEAERKFKEVNEAYSILSDPEKKAKYDQFGSAAFDGSGGFGGGGFGDFGDFGDIFSNIFGGGFGGFGGGSSRRNGPVDGDDIAVRLTLTFEEAAKGLKRDVTYHRVQKCSDCGGTGAEKGSEVETCSKCHGTGRIRVQQRTMFGVMQSEQACDACRGSGKIIKKPCGNCNGKGYVKVSKTLSVNIPAGMDDGQRMALRGQGNEGRNGGVAGDLIIVFTVLPHEIFTREGYDLYCEVPVTFTDAALGAEIEVPTLDGKIKHTIPDGTQPGTTFRIRDKGIPRVNGKGKGDLYFTVNVEVPKNLSGTQKDLLRKFADSCGEKNYTKKSGFFKKFFS
ncbi:MAG: molecular chaperone DnaJ [Clostridia bacterium]|nr:molecular chaperone DnaJ [Clostridia bacterium]